MYNQSCLLHSICSTDDHFVALSRSLKMFVDNPLRFSDHSIRNVDEAQRKLQCVR